MLPNIWPLFNIINIINFPEKPCKQVPSEKREPKKKGSNQYGYLSELIGRNLRLSTYWIVAFIVMLYAFPSYDEFMKNDNLTQFMLKWTVIICIRDLFIVAFFYYLWHWILFDSPWSQKLKRVKYNKEYPAQSQWDRSRFWSFVTTLIVSANEIGVIYVIKNNKWLLYKNFWNDSDVYYWINEYIPSSYHWMIHTLYGIFWLYATPYILDAHFYWVHRAQHQWNWKLFGLFDPGYYIYKYVHKHHHIDINMGPWSALCVHPIEAILDVNGIFIPIIFFYFNVHPIHILFNKFYNILSPLPNHDGFDEPGGASYYHYLHHAHFECNYGSPMVPFDAYFGSFEDGKRYKKKENDANLNMKNKKQ